MTRRDFLRASGGAFAGTGVLGLAVVSGACSSESGSGSSSFTYAGRNILSFLPAGDSEPVVSEILFDGLMELDPDTSRPREQIAAAVESSDNKTWRIRLKRGWEFHNGDPVTARSFADAWSFSALATNALRDARLFNVIEGYDQLSPAEGEPTAESLSGVEVTGEYALTVTLSRPFTLFPYLLATDAYSPLPRLAIEDQKAFDRNPVGNGPYRLTGGYRQNQTTVTFQRWDDYRGEPGKAEQIVQKTVTEFGGATVFNEVQAGSIDVAFLTEGDVMEQARSALAGRIQPFSNNAVLYLGFTTWDETFDDPRIRQALSQAVDRETIVRTLLGGFGKPAYGVAPDNVIGGGERICSTCAFDPGGARELLEQAGGLEGPLVLSTYQDDPLNVQITQAIANQWRNNLGIENVELEASPVDQLYARLFDQKGGGAVFLYQGGFYPHVYALADQLLTSNGVGNVVGYDSPDYDELLRRAGASRTEDEATSRTQEAVGLALEDARVSPIFHPESALVWSERVDNVKSVAPFGNPDLASVTVSA